MLTAFSLPRHWIIASHNAGKVAEIQQLLLPFGFTVSSAAEHNLPEPEENGSSFAANAQIKSQSALQHSGQAALADDSGLVVPLLGGAPGIYSARWAGPGKDFSVAMDRLYTECNAKGDTAPEAYFVCVLSLSQPNQPDQVFEGRVYGTLQFPPSGAAGFGYDPIFVPKGYAESFADMPSAEKQRISHRRNAFNLLVDWLKAEESQTA